MSPVLRLLGGGLMVRHRRNNAFAGIVMLLGALAVAAGSTQPWIRIQGRELGLSALDSLLEVGLNPSISTGLLENDARPVLLVCAAVIGLSALALVATRVRGPGVLWRVVALLVVVLPGLIAAQMWSVIGAHDTRAFSVEKDQSVIDEVLGGVARLAEAAGIVEIQPTPGLFLMTGGVLAVVIGMLIPAGRRTEVIAPPAGWAPPDGWVAPQTGH